MVGKRRGRRFMPRPPASKPPPAAVQRAKPPRMAPLSARGRAALGSPTDEADGEMPALMHSQRVSRAFVSSAVSVLLHQQRSKARLAKQLDTVQEETGDDGGV